MLHFLFFIFSSQIFIKQLVKFQGIKTRDQVVDDAKTVGMAFSQKDISDVDLINYLSTCDIFKFKDNGELIASVYLKRNTYYKKVDYLFVSRIEEIKAVEIYSLWVNSKFRRKGIARMLLFKALMTIRKEYNYGNDFVVSLHLNEADKYMNISFALYYALNFRKGAYVKHGPDDLKYNFELIHKLYNPIDIILGKKQYHNDNGETYFAMYTTFKDLKCFNPIKKSHFEIGEMLRKDLKERKRKFK